jgi:ATP-dependent Clp protease ATP-binding subunit ClpC
VKYDESMFKSCIKLCKRYITERCLPDSAIDILDKTGAKASLNDVENDNITSAREKLYKIKEEKEKLKNSSSKKDYNKIDQLSKEEIELNTILNFAVKSYNLEKQPFVVRENDIRECISEKTGIPINSLSTDDKEKLKGLNERIKSVVIGQDEAVDEVCKSIKRQRVGISNPNKPVVFLLAGSTGVGKTYLAKTLAKEVFGDEKKFVRLDMSEYSEKNSVTKLYGAPPSYVGYDNGGLLTETIKRNKHCVLLLDEIEKANEEVHNTFLSLFDEGRLTDNKGVTVNFKDVIIIMTSNVGAKEVEERGGSIGFVNNEESNKKSIIEKELKRKFKPEFINRIDKIVYFNKLTDSNIKNIILLELNKTKKRVEEIGYYLSDELIKNHLVSNIFNKVKEHKNMGARPIIREIQNELEDKITDLIIDGLVEKGHTFTKEELGC